MGKIKEFVKDVTGGCPHYMIVKEENPLDRTTPVGVPLAVCGWGFNGKNIDYGSVIGFDQISKTEEDQYYILTNKTGCWVIRKSLDHEKLFSETNINRAAEWHYEEEDEEEFDDEYAAARW